MTDVRYDVEDAALMLTAIRARTRLSDCFGVMYAAPVLATILRRDAEFAEFVNNCWPTVERASGVTDNPIPESSIERAKRLLRELEAAGYGRRNPPHSETP